MKIAVVGGGASGLVAARRLTMQGHDVTVFEASDRCGGHAHSVSLESEAVRDPIEVGFLVFNQAACPRLTDLLAELQTLTREIPVAYEVCNPQSGMVLRGSSLRELLSVPRNLTVPSFYGVVPDWIRFTRQARRRLRTQQESDTTSLGEFLSRGSYSRAFAEQFVYPLAEAVNPQRREKLADIPLASLLGFIYNHGLLKLNRDLSCQTLAEGSREYVDRLTGQFREHIQLNCPVAAVARHDDYVLLKFPNRSRERFEQVVLAVHADVALRLLADPTRPERHVLESFDYASQNVYIHWQDNQSRSSDAPAVWSFQPSARGPGGVAWSYRISQVQAIDAPESLMLTMIGGDQPPPEKVIQTIRFRRPVFSAKSLLAQRQFGRINGQRRTFFCGSYWGHGFHEDAVRSAEQVAQRLACRPGQELAVSC